MQWRVQEYVRGGAENLGGFFLFFFAFQFLGGGGPVMCNTINVLL